MLHICRHACIRPESIMLQNLPTIMLFGISLIFCLFLEMHYTDKSLYHFAENDHDRNEIEL